MSQGVNAQEAYDRIYLIDSKGLVLAERYGLESYKQAFAKQRDWVSNWNLKRDEPLLQDVIENARVSVLVGISGQKGAFTRTHVDAMLAITNRPVIFPLTNPVEDSEAKPADIYQWSRGKAIVATGSVAADVVVENRTYRIAQASNAFVFPGVGLAAMISKVSVITDEVFLAAAHALASCVSNEDLNNGIVYPRLKDIQKVGVRVATEVLKEILQRNPDIGFKKEDLFEVVRSKVWKPIYHPYRRV